ncbi:MAG: hypothetical protein IJ092_12020, partial [Atopobiaceae bacterium]|nr:hypothetical protein [Atopobiaceae bacterium]
NETFLLGEVACIEIDGSLYYGKGWSFRGYQIRERWDFAAIYTLRGLDEAGRPRFTCTDWTCE